MVLTIPKKSFSCLLLSQVCLSQRALSVPHHSCWHWSLPLWLQISFCQRSLSFMECFLELLSTSAKAWTWFSLIISQFPPEVKNSDSLGRGLKSTDRSTFHLSLNSCSPDKCCDVMKKTAKSLEGGTVKKERAVGGGGGFRAFPAWSSKNLPVKIHSERCSVLLFSLCFKHLLC